MGDLGCSVQSQARFCPAGLLSAFSCSSTGWNPTRCVRPTQADRGAPPRLLFSDCLLGNPPAEAGWDPGCTGHIQAEATQGVGSGVGSGWEGRSLGVAVCLELQPPAWSLRESDTGAHWEGRVRVPQGREAFLVPRHGCLQGALGDPEWQDGWWTGAQNPQGQCPLLSPWVPVAECLPRWCV